MIEKDLVLKVPCQLRLSKSGLYFKSKVNSKIETRKIAIKIEDFTQRLLLNRYRIAKSQIVKSQSKSRIIPIQK